MSGVATTPVRTAPGATGRAFLRSHASRRPLWSVALSVHVGESETVATRRFSGIDAIVVSEEVAAIAHDGGLRHVRSRQAHLGEDASADVVSTPTGARVTYRLTRDGATRERSEHVRVPVVTMASLPLHARLHADALLAGRPMRARVPVLKVMRSAIVALRARRTPEGVDVRVTPTSPLLRLLFGTTVYRFDAALTTLVGYRGLLDPRDRTRSGRWHEYLGEIELDRPLALPTPATHAPGADR